MIYKEAIRSVLSIVFGLQFSCSVSTAIYMYNILQGTWIEWTINIVIIADHCPLYKISEEYESDFSSPGFPDNLLRNGKCEIYFRAKELDKVIHLRFLELSLSPSDSVTVFDDLSYSDDIASYSSAEKPYVSVTSKGHSIRIVFNLENAETMCGPRFRLLHKAFAAGKYSSFYHLYANIRFLYGFPQFPT